MKPRGIFAHNGSVFSNSCYYLSLSANAYAKPATLFGGDILETSHQK
jgi:hypothetical protein